MHYLAVQRYSQLTERMPNKMILVICMTIMLKMHEPYACADMHFDPKPPTKEVLNRYNITDKEYYDICNELESELYVGRCGWCI